MKKQAIGLIYGCIEFFHLFWWCKDLIDVHFETKILSVFQKTQFLEIIGGTYVGN